MEVKSRFLELFIEHVLPVLFTALAGVLTWACSQLAMKLKAQAEGSKLAAVAAKFAHFGEVVVADLETTLKPAMLEASADGQITPEEGKKLRAMAVERIKLMATEQGLTELSKVMGMSDAWIDTYLAGVVEKAVSTVAVGKEVVPAPAAVPLVTPGGLP